MGEEADFAMEMAIMNGEYDDSLYPRKLRFQRREYKYTGIWVTAEGIPYLPEEMESRHIRNCLRMIRRRMWRDRLWRWRFRWELIKRMFR